MVITSFKTELEAFSIPPQFLFFDWTIENYDIVQERSNYLRFAMNSIMLAVGSTLLGLLIAIPAAWAMAFAPDKRTKDLLLWMLSTKMMPPVGALDPDLSASSATSACSTSRVGLIVVLFLLDLPIVDLDALHLFQGDPGRDPGSGAHGRRDACGRRSSMC